jgi:hypothetical protein
VDDDNNGLWTAAVAAAELFRYAATDDPAAAASARQPVAAEAMPTPPRIISSVVLHTKYTGRREGDSSLAPAPCTARRFLGGLRLLHDVTGVPGLY